MASLVLHLNTVTLVESEPLPPSAIQADGLSKEYAGHGLAVLLTGARPRPGSAGAHRALSDVSFELRRGSALGVIGRNGAGKSTLLRILAGVSRPSAGRLEVRGSVRSLLELGSGFVEELSGEANTRAALALDGVPAASVKQMLAAATEFAGIGDFARQPVRIYSSGMRLRLAYAIAIAVRPEILIADEILAVGDEAFQRKCSRHILDYVAAGGTLVLATHNMFHVEKLCQTALWLERGVVRAYGPARDVTASYRASIETEARPGSEDAETAAETRWAEPSASADRDARLTLHCAGNRAPGELCALGEPMTVIIEAGARAGLDVARAARHSLDFVRSDGTTVLSVRVRGTRLHIPRLPLLPGRYCVRLRADDEGSRRVLAERWFDCRGASRELGTARLEHAWGPGAARATAS